MALKGKQLEVLAHNFDKNLLVTAAAGSGKTRVLTEKIIQMIKNDEDVSLRDILVMTFTVKATQEMKSRIKKSIDDEIERITKELDNVNDLKKGYDKIRNKLIKESSMIQNANITTIDSFCKSIVEKYYSVLSDSDGLYKNFDPMYRIADEKELSVLYDDVLNDLLEEEVYANLDEYKEFVDTYFRKDGDYIIKEKLFLKAYDFLNTIPKPISKIEDWLVNYENNNDKYREDINRELCDRIKKSFEFLLDKETNETISSIVKAIIKCYNDKVDKLTDEYIKSHKNPEANYELRNKLNALIQSLNDIALILSNVLSHKNSFDDFFSEMKKDSLYLNLNETELLAKTKINIDGYESYKNAFEKCIPAFEPFIMRSIRINELKYNNNENEKVFLKLIKKFYIKVVEEKVKKNIYAISDYAILAYEILDSKNDDVINEIRNKYKYIFIDEYQDTSFIQEAILLKISGENNLVMVGDVKQSIYGFRNAEPSIFLDKIDIANGKISSPDKREYKLISMNRNFRSSEVIIGFINQLFDEIMTSDFAKIEYKTEGRMEADKDKCEEEDAKDKEAGRLYDKKVEVHVVCNEKLYNYNIELNKLREMQGIYEKELSDKNNTLKTEDNEDTKTKIQNEISEVTAQINTIKEQKKILKDKYKGIADEVDDEDTPDAESDTTISDGVSTSANEVEAEFVARKIEYLVNNCGFKYKDIAILFRSFYSKADVYIEALARHNIPVFSVMKKGFFGRTEIVLMQDILSVIDNEQQDIPLVNVLCSNLFGLTNDEIAFIKLMGLKLKSGSKFINSVRLSYNSLPYINDDNFKNTVQEKYEFKIRNLKEYYKYKELKLLNDGILTDEKKAELSGTLSKSEKYLTSKMKRELDDIGKYKEEAIKYTNNINFDDTYNKLKLFIEKFDMLRTSARYYSIKELIELIYDELDIKNVMLSMNDGIIRVANLEVLKDLATGFESTSFVGLFNFLRYLEKIKELNNDQGLANVSDENDDVVRIMTIHASKGLEFNCVFLCGTSSSYNLKDSSRSQRLQVDIENGLTLDNINLKEHYNVETPKKRMISNDKKYKVFREEMRMLYVALTRAKRKLIITGAVDGRPGIFNKLYVDFNSSYTQKYKNFVPESMDSTVHDKSDTKNANVLNSAITDNGQDVIDLTKCDSYIKLILSAIKNPSEYCEIYRQIITMDEAEVTNKTNLTLKKVIDESIDEQSELDKIKSDARSVGLKGLVDNLQKEVLDENIDNFKYDYNELKKIIKPKFSVSEIKKEHYESKIERRLEKNNKGAESTGYYNSTSIAENKQQDKQRKDSTDVGNIYHRVMQFYNFSKIDDENEITKLVKSTDKSKSIDLIKQIKEKVNLFLESDIGKRMQKAYESGKLYREYKFMKLFTHNQVKEMLEKFGVKGIESIEGIAKDEKNIVIQGIVDAFFIENDKIIVVDYKTDGLKNNYVNEKELVNNYKVQLDLYAEVLHELSGYDVSDKYLYSFTNNEKIVID